MFSYILFLMINTGICPALSDIDIFTHINADKVQEITVMRWMHYLSVFAFSEYTGHLLT